MSISVIIPTLNEEAHIGILLTSLSNCNHKDQFEVIVVDGGSTDRTTSITNAHEATLLSSTSCSRACQMNLGGKQGPQGISFILFTQIPFRLKTLCLIYIRLLKKVFKVAATDLSFKTRPIRYYILMVFFTRFPFKWCRGGDQTLYITRKVFDELAGFNEGLCPLWRIMKLLDRLELTQTSFKIIPKSVKVSARKYLKNPYLKVQIANFKAMKMYKKGLDPIQVKNYYTRVLN